eukprot:1108356-Rhodomonas_salina.1
MSLPPGSSESLPPSPVTQGMVLRICRVLSPRGERGKAMHNPEGRFIAFSYTNEPQFLSRSLGAAISQILSPPPSDLD